MGFTIRFLMLGKHLHGLAHAASKYHKVLEENCKLYNQVQDLKGENANGLDTYILTERLFILSGVNVVWCIHFIGNIRVYCRIRPFMPGKPNHLSTVEDLDERTITILTSSKYGKEGRKSFTFNKVFGPSASQGH